MHGLYVVLIKNVVSQGVWKYSGQRQGMIPKSTVNQSSSFSFGLERHFEIQWHCPLKKISMKSFVYLRPLSYVYTDRGLYSCFTHVKHEYSCVTSTDIHLKLYKKLSYARILIGSHL